MSREMWIPSSNLPFPNPQVKSVTVTTVSACPPGIPCASSKLVKVDATLAKLIAAFYDSKSQMLRR